MQALIFPAINFIILLSFIIYKTKAPFFQFMKKRHQDVFDGLNKSKVQAATAAAKKAEVELKLSKLDSEKATIQAEWKSKETQQIKALGESTERIMAQMKAEAIQNKKSLEVTLQSEMTRNFNRAVIAQAEQKIKAALNAETHAKINQTFVKDVGVGVSAS